MLINVAILTSTSVTKRPNVIEVINIHPLYIYINENTHKIYTVYEYIYIYCIVCTMHVGTLLNSLIDS